jgi:two-component system sensor kinase
LHEEYINNLDDEAKRLMRIVMQNADKMDNLIDDLLTFSRLGRKEMRKVQLNVYDMVTALADEQRNAETNRNITIEIDKLPAIHADTISIKQVWTNLLSNAIKYTRLNDKAIIEIGVMDNKTETIYYVKDNGTGFDMRYVDKLFGVFQRLHDDDEFEGTGVGLAIVQRIIAKHEGRVWAEAALGKGATFYFSLPKSSTL